MSPIIPGGIATRSPSPPPGGCGTVADHPWRDSNPSSFTTVKVSRPSPIIPGGIATRRPFLRPCPRPASPIIPGGIATSCCRGNDRCSHVADHPWRDSNASCCGVCAVVSRSPIIPGGIATCRPSRTTSRRGAVADHPWRDSNPGSTYSSSASSLPVADHPWRDSNAGVMRSSSGMSGRRSSLEG